MEFYDPDAQGEAPRWATETAAVDEPTSTVPSPVPELLILGAALALGIGLVWWTSAGLSGGLFSFGIALAQIAYPLVTALVVAAIVSLLLRRVLRGHRQAQTEQFAALRDELAELADRIDAFRR